MSEFKQNVNTYSADGRIFQVEYAMKAMNLGTTTIGMKTNSHVILVSEKKLLSKLQNPLSVKKHFKIYDHTVLGFSGISGDAKTIVEKTRNFCVSHSHLYNENVDIEKLLKHMCSLSLKFSEENMEKKIFSRPFGVSVLIAGYDTEPRLFSLDPSGSYISYTGKAIGSGHEAVETLLEDAGLLDLEEAIRKILDVLSKVMKDQITKNNVEVAIVGKEGVNFLLPDEILVHL